MADVHCAHMRLAVARRRQSEDQLDIGLELRLVVFDDHDIIAPRRHNRLRHLSLREQGIHRHDAAGEDDLAEHRLDLGDLIRFGGHSLLRQRQSYTVGQNR